MLKRIIHFLAIFSGRGTYMWPGPVIARAGRRIIHRKSILCAFRLFIGLMFVCHSGFGWGQTLLDNYDGVGGLTYTTEGTWVINGGQYEGQTGSVTTPEHSYASYDLSNSFAGWSLSAANQNCWFGWMDLNRASVSGWGTDNYSCAMVLAANNADFNAGTTSGYAIGFRDSDDQLVLFSFSAGIVNGTVNLPGTSVLVVSSTYYYADADNGVNFFVEKLTTGEWRVSYKWGTKLSDANASNKANYSDGSVLSGVNNTYTGATYKYAGWAYAHSTGVNDKAYFDNFGAGQTSVTNVTSPSFSNVCINSLDLSWTLPGGYNAGTNTILVFAKATSAITLGTPSSNVSTYTANSNFSGGGTVYQNDPLAKCVYKGDGTTFSITGLNPKTAYYFLIFNVLDPNTYSTGTLANRTTAPTNISPYTAASGNGQVTLTWTNPTSCYDEIMIVAKPSAPVTASPSGDGSTYTANLAFGSGTLFDGTGRVVYKGSASPQTVTALTNGTVYYFKAFTRRGTNWSDGVEINATPSTAATNDYRSLASGSWATNTTWEKYNGTIWNPCGAGDFPNVSTSNVTIRNGHTVTLNSSFTVKNIVVENGGKVNAITSGTNRYINVWGSSIVCDGTIGNGSIYDEICFNVEGTDVTISGTGAFDCVRIRKNNAATNFTTNLTISRNINLRWGTSSGTSLYNNAAGVFNVLINNGVTVSLIGGDDGFGNPVTGNCSIDGVAGADGSLINGSITVNGTLKITGTLYLKTNNATAGRGCSFNIGSTGVVYVGTIDAAASGAAGNTLTINNGGKLIITGLTPFSAFSNTNNTYNLNAGSIVEYAANGNQAIQTGWGSYSNLILSNSGNKSLSSALDVNMDLLISGSSILVSNNNNTNIGGNWTNYGTAGFTEGTSTVIFDGSTNQTITCPTGENFNNMTVSNASGVTLADKIMIAANLIMSSGILTTNANEVDLSSTGTITETVINPSSYVLGNLKSTRSIGSSVNQTFGGIGLEINETGAANSTVVTRVTGTQLPGNAPCCNSNLSIKRYFDIVPTTNTGLNATMRFHYFNYELNGMLDTDLLLYKAPLPYAPDTWVEQGGPSVTLNAANNHLTKTGVNSFSRWTAARQALPLPVEILFFTAKINGQNVNLNWSTASETNNDFFMVEHSADAKLFNPLFSVKAAGNSNQVINYSAIDTYPLKGINYYRLKQTDYDSKVSYSKIVSVNISENNCDFNLSSVYVQNNILKIQLNCIDSDVTIDITDINGRIVLTQQIDYKETNQLISLVLPDLNKGIFLLRATTDKSVVVRKFYL